MRHISVQKNYFFIVFFLMILLHKVTSQTSLNPGDIAILSLDADGKTFRFVPMVDLDTGTEIFFTDSGWLTTNVPESFRANEGAVKYIAPSPITAGTNIEYRYIE